MSDRFVARPGRWCEPVPMGSMIRDGEIIVALYCESYGLRGLYMHARAFTMKGREIPLYENLHAMDFRSLSRRVVRHT